MGKPGGGVFLKKRKRSHDPASVPGERGLNGAFARKLLRDAMLQFVHTEWFSQRGEIAHLNHPAIVLFGMHQSRHQDDRHAPQLFLAPNVFRQDASVDLGHHEIQQNEIGPEVDRHG
jgi:hypothetical protein